MCSFNQVNGVYACENPILDNLLKGDAGFDGYVVSDFGSVHSTGPAITGGLDQELNRPRFFTPANIHAGPYPPRARTGQTAGADRATRGQPRARTGWSRFRAVGKRPGFVDPETSATGCRRVIPFSQP